MQWELLDVQPCKHIIKSMMQQYLNKVFALMKAGMFTWLLNLGNPLCMAFHNLHARVSELRNRMKADRCDVTGHLNLAFVYWQSHLSLIPSLFFFFAVNTPILLADTSALLEAALQHLFDESTISCA